MENPFPMCSDMLAAEPARVWPLGQNRTTGMSLLHVAHLALLKVPMVRTLTGSTAPIFVHWANSVQFSHLRKFANLIKPNVRFSHYV